MKKDISPMCNNLEAHDERERPTIRHREKKHETKWRLSNFKEIT